MGPGHISQRYVAISLERNITDIYVTGVHVFGREHTFASGSGVFSHEVYKNLSVMY